MEDKTILHSKLQKTLLFILSILLLPIIVSSKLDAKDFCDRFYFRVEGGADLMGAYTVEVDEANLQETTLGRTWVYGAGLGYALSRDFRLEAKVTSRPAINYQYYSETVSTLDVTIGKLRSETATLGLYYNLFHLNKSTPYIGLGGGYARNKIFDNKRLIGLDVGTAIPLSNRTVNSYCFFVSTGTLIDIARHWQIDIGGSYVNLGQIGPISPYRAKMDNIAVFEFTIGLLFRFP